MATNQLFHLSADEQALNFAQANEVTWAAYKRFVARCASEFWDEAGEPDAPIRDYDILEAASYTVGALILVRYSTQRDSYFASVTDLHDGHLNDWVDVPGIVHPNTKSPDHRKVTILLPEPPEVAELEQLYDGTVAVRGLSVVQAARSPRKILLDNKYGNYYKHELMDRMHELSGLATLVEEVEQHAAPNDYSSAA
ncbi:MAG: hypothetical protein JWS12_851 [Candidatus Saccharibacteria bacterium]|nr:hypothetical protein [Candidatus Saccharibacteria bacterium]